MVLLVKDQLEPLKDLLNDKYEVLTMSFIGHGDREETSENFSIPLFSRDLLSFLDENNIERIKIFGYSMGR